MDHKTFVYCSRYMAATIYVTLLRIDEILNQRARPKISLSTKILTKPGVRRVNLFLADTYKKSPIRARNRGRSAVNDRQTLRRDRRKLLTHDQDDRPLFCKWNCMKLDH